MIKLWNSVTREDVMKEVIPGVWAWDERMAERLDWTSYISHMHELMRDGTTQNEQAVREHFDDLTFLIFGEKFHMTNGVEPTADEIREFRNLPSTIKLVEDLTSTTMHMTERDWPAYKMFVCKRYGIDQEEFDQAFE